MAIVYAGFTLDKLGTFNLGGVDASGAWYAIFSTGSYFSNNAVSPVTTHYGFKGTLQTEIRAESGDANYTVSFSDSTRKFTVANTTLTSFTLSANTLAQSIMGFTAGVHSGSNSYTSDVVPYYVIKPAVDARVEWLEQQEMSGLVRSATRADGDIFSLAPTALPKLHSWSYVHESQATTFRDFAASATPWTWQHLFEHCGCDEPIAVEDDASADLYATGTAYWITAEGSPFVPEQPSSDYEDDWSIPFFCQLIGTY